MGNFTELASAKVGRNKFMTFLYKVLVGFNLVDNGIKLQQNQKCFKILTFDDDDDVVDSFASLHNSVA